MHRRAFLAGCAVAALTPLAAQAAAPKVFSGHPVAPSLAYTIDTAEAEMIAAFSGCWPGLASNAVWDHDTTVTDATGLQTALTAASSTASGSIAITQKHRIVCDWDGVSTVGDGTGSITAKGYGTRVDGHSDNGGGIYVVAAAGRTPAVGNMVNVLGLRGIHFNGLGFAKQWSGTGAQETQYGIQTQVNGSNVELPIVILENANVGAAYFYPAAADTQWVGGFNASGTPEYVFFKNCRFWGHENAIACPGKFVRYENVDIQLAKQDFNHWFGHFTGGAYLCRVWMDRVTCRNPADSVSNRNNHMDGGQTGTLLDAHLGYRILARDVIIHANHSYNGDPGQGGGTQGFYNDDHLTADNQFVLRRCLIAVSAPAGFAFFSPAATKKSFIDATTFTRCGVVPSNLPGDVNAAQDFAVGVTGSGTGNVLDGNIWLTVTNTIAGTMTSGTFLSAPSVLICDPRNVSRVTVDQRPETIFKGTFLRDEYIAGKMSYHLAGENGATPSSRTQAQFVADMWAQFEPQTAYAAYGLPDPRSLF